MTEPLRPMRWPPPSKPWPQLDPAAQAPPLIWLIDRRCHALVAQRPLLQSLLSAAEQRRIERLRRDDDRDRSLLGRGALRLVLGGLIGQDPATLPLTVGPGGKPQLAAQVSPQFNISHSGALVLLAFHATCPVGVDVERQRAGLRWQPIARRCFDPALCRQIEALPPSKQRLAFLRHWCRLEATLKAQGTGILAPPLPSPPATALHELQLPEGYAGAVAMVCAAGP
ncbi:MULTISPECIES: 4'-phosphopantetheinyl transferase superfamily protein [unclassified Synechococcus]|uniref:4'-phosphopantetheinyl transferase family protein n=1 Tax=unclassified Synechococcus TaxID=2626047 RepID=UPI0008FF23C4|nr:MULTISPECIES: 4'-phosphopantetheinyl transferase superfamily protein [unclassified Synechococcus]APD47832.1 hypothetical protein BM449_05620 [Synechococcus sp. SynAce01]MCT0202928.1 4'-phosphopantetheinyl transferase superfamily protein [Synechococcus sp. CS-603]MCT0245187.1 4'-phosphopantetheinyl transferase superfamily protein [Synechococcus sp. CS-601]MCT4363882.1 4'-phosphopantetheinyl transferase superfamily protein [Candidatus Regnicoccus frigidus MAG-AL1]